MTIALIAHDAKKELMIQFCIAYRGILSHHSLCATGTTGRQVSEATGLRIQQFMSGRQGGDQQIASRISCNEIDLLIFFRDPITRKASEPNELNLLRLCDVHNIPLATNIATAEALIMALQRGDLDWREIGSPSFSGEETSDENDAYRDSYRAAFSYEAPDISATNPGKQEQID